MSSGRPLAALAALAVGVAGWLAGRSDRLAEDFAAARRQSAPAAPAAAPVLPAAPAALPAAPAATPPQPTIVQQPIIIRERTVYITRIIHVHEPAGAPPATAAAPPALAAGPTVAPFDVAQAAPPAAPTTQAQSPAAGQASAAPAQPLAYDLATAGYAKLREGKRREGVELLDAALALQPYNGQWQHDRKRVAARWHGEAFTLLRELGPTGPTTLPVLGGGQIGGQISYTINPLGKRPIAIVARGNAGADAQGVDPATVQSALGVRITPMRGVTVSAERLFAHGPAVRNDWTLRVAAGGTAPFWDGRLSGYGEAGVLASDGNIYAGGLASARILRIGPVVASAGAWGGFQTGPFMVGRLDVGPTLAARWGAIGINTDWRFRVVGNAVPGNGPTLTLTAGF
jgi:hypothetical protein